MPKKKRGRQLGIQLRLKPQLAFQDRRISMRLSGMKLPMLLTPLVLLNPLGLPLLNLTKQVPGEEKTIPSSITNVPDEVLGGMSKSFSFSS